MGVFKKKPDPFSERARALNTQIEALEEEIRRLHSQEASARPEPEPPPEEKPTPPAEPSRPAKSGLRHALPELPPTQPRLRSTARPKSAAPTTNPFAGGTSSSGTQSVVDEADQGPLHGTREPDSPEHYNELGLRKYDLHSAWTRFKSHFRGPVASNPKLVNYLAAGSIQGLRPLRYEKRVARNRFLVFVTVLILALWGLGWILWRR